MLLGFLEQWQRDGLKNPELQSWLDRFQLDKKEAATAWWSEVKRGIEAAFAAGPEAIPNILTGGQKKNFPK